VHLISQYKKHANKYGCHRILSEFGPRYTEHGLREQFGVSIMSADWRGTLWTLLVNFCIVIIRSTETFWSPCIWSVPSVSDVLYIYIYISSVWPIQFKKRWWRQWIFPASRFSHLYAVFKACSCVLFSNTHMFDTNCLISPHSVWISRHWKLKWCNQPFQANQIPFSYATSSAGANNEISAALPPYRSLSELHITSL
jgi:hypothetical protein